MFQEGGLGCRPLTSLLGIKKEGALLPFVLNFTESQNKLGQKGPARIIEPNSWPCTGLVHLQTPLSIVVFFWGGIILFQTEEFPSGQNVWLRLMENTRSLSSPRDIGLFLAGCIRKWEHKKGDLMVLVLLPIAG